MLSFVRFTMALVALFSISTMTFAQSKGFDTTRMDTSVNACNDFYQFPLAYW